MRHAFDADHIAAIDNTTRKLMSNGQRPLAVGFFFSLGHSTVVFGLAVLLASGVKGIAGPVARRNLLAAPLHRRNRGQRFGYLPLRDRRSSTSSSWWESCGCSPASPGRLDEKGAELERQLEQPRATQSIPGPLHHLDHPVLAHLPDRVAVRPGFRHRDRDRAFGPGGRQRGGRAAVVRHPVSARLVHRWHVPARHHRRLIHQLRLRLGLFQPGRKIYYNITITGLSVAVAFLIGSIELLGPVRRATGSAGCVLGLARRAGPQHAGLRRCRNVCRTWAVALLVWRYGRMGEVVPRRKRPESVAR